MMRGRKRAAFTLVELLVVIAIIGILVSLMIPAITVARNIARQSQCLNNANQVGTAMHSFATTKDRFPGRLEGIPTSKFPKTNRAPGQPVTWVARLLPELGRNDAYDRLLADSNYLLYLDVLVCPSDPPESLDAPVLSYVVNTGTWDQPPQKLDHPANGICHDLFGLYRYGLQSQAEVTLDYITRHDGLSQTLLLSENADATTWSPMGAANQGPGQATEGDHGMVWFATADTFIGLNQLIGEAPLAADDPRFARPSSHHSGGVNAIFADGHGAFISQDIDYRIYGQLLTPYGAKSIHYQANNSTPAFQIELLLQTNMYTN